jgi:hypothetical protein
MLRWKQSAICRDDLSADAARGQVDAPYHAVPVLVSLVADQRPDLRARLISRLPWISQSRRSRGHGLARGRHQHRQRADRTRRRGRGQALDQVISHTI